MKVKVSWLSWEDTLSQKEKGVWGFSSVIEYVPSISPQHWAVELSGVVEGSKQSM